MIDDMGAHHVLQTTRNPPVNAPRIRRSKNGFHASMALYPKVPGLHIAKSCSGSPHPARPTTRIRARQKRLQRLSRHSDTSDCSERLPKKERSDPNSVPTSSNPVSRDLMSEAATRRSYVHLNSFPTGQKSVPYPCPSTVNRVARVKLSTPRPRLRTLHCTRYTCLGCRP